MTVNAKNEIKSISYYDKNNKRYKQVDIGYTHKVDGNKLDPHKHKGYLHDEKGTFNISKKEKNMIDRVKSTWYYHISRE